MKEKLKFEEFMNTPMNMNSRKELNYSDEFVIRKAKIYRCLGPNDDRLQLQVLPELQNIDDEEMDDLPKYPPFFQGQVITGLSYKEDGDKAEYVWVICTPDLIVGYILGKANIFGESDKKYEYSYNYSSIKSFIQQRKALPDDFDYNHIQIVNWVATDTGGMIQCYNYITGDWVLLNTSGSIITVQQKRIYMRVGSPPDPISAGPVGFSSVEMTPDKFFVKSTTIELDSKMLILGKHGLQLGALAGMAPSNDNGVPVVPIPNILV